MLDRFMKKNCWGIMGISCGHGTAVNILFRRLRNKSWKPEHLAMNGV
jgi:hypothetical protein